MSFLVTGLPRSGSTWMSVFLTEGINKCRHEAIATTPSFKDYIEMHKKGIGNSDCSAILIFNEIIQRLPDLKVILLDRGIKEVEKSLRNANLDVGPVLYEMNKMIPVVKRHIMDVDGIVVRYPDFTNVKMARQIWDYVAKGRFNEMRHFKLSRNKITTPNEVLKERARIFESNRMGWLDLEL